MEIREKKENYGHTVAVEKLGINSQEVFLMNAGERRCQIDPRGTIVHIVSYICII